MQNVVLVLLSVLIIIVIAIVFVGYKKLSSFRVQISKLQLDVLSLRNFIDERLLSGGSSPMVGLTHPGPMNMHPTMVPANTSHLEPTNEEPVVEEVTEEESTEEETVTDDSDEDESETDSEEEEENETNEENVDGKAVEENEETEDTEDTEEDDDKEIELEVDNDDGVESLHDKAMNDVYTKMISIAKSTELPPTNTLEVSSQPKKRRRKSPNTKPSTFDIGHVELSENDGNYYVVVTNRNNVRRWQRYNKPVENKVTKETEEIEESVEAPVEKTEETTIDKLDKVHEEVDEDVEELASEIMDENTKEVAV
tara:strand:- start:841 stop:1773 length:933 start_codon:yes stop_codon:yes gene_type:complete